MSGGSMPGYKVTYSEPANELIIEPDSSTYTYRFTMSILKSSTILQGVYKYTAQPFIEPKYVAIFWTLFAITLYAVAIIAYSKSDIK